MLEDLDPWIMRQLCEYIRGAQMEKSFVSRSNSLANEALQKHAEWLALQDMPVVLEPVDRAQIHRDSPKLSPPSPTKPHRIVSLSSPAGLRAMLPILGSRETSSLRWMKFSVLIDRSLLLLNHPYQELYGNGLPPHLGMQCPLLSEVLR